MIMNVSVLCHNSKYTVEQKSLFLSGLKDLLLPKKRKKKKYSKRKAKKRKQLAQGEGPDV